MLLEVGSSTSTIINLNCLDLLGLFLGFLDLHSLQRYHLMTVETFYLRLFISCSITSIDSDLVPSSLIQDNYARNFVDTSTKSNEFNSQHSLLGNPCLADAGMGHSMFVVDNDGSCTQAVWALVVALRITYNVHNKYKYNKINSSKALPMPKMSSASSGLDTCLIHSKNNDPEVEEERKGN
ncbi:hypothetical protein Tco_0151759 [Tanacetum coccineum]